MGFGTLWSMRVASCRRGETNWPGKQQPGMKKGAAGWVKGPDGGAMLSFNPECGAWALRIIRSDQQWSQESGYSAEPLQNAGCCEKGVLERKGTAGSVKNNDFLWKNPGRKTVCWVYCSDLFLLRSEEDGGEVDSSQPIPCTNCWMNWMRMNDLWNRGKPRFGVRYWRSRTDLPGLECQANACCGETGWGIVM